MKKTLLILGLIISINSAFAVSFEKSHDGDFSFYVDGNLIQIWNYKRIEYSQSDSTAKIYHLAKDNKLETISIPMTEGEEKTLERILDEELESYKNHLKEKQQEALRNNALPNQNYEPVNKQYPQNADVQTQERTPISLHEGIRESIYTVNSLLDLLNRFKR